MSILSTLCNLRRERESGQALVEYGLILALVALVAIVGLTVMGNDVDGLYGVIEDLAQAMADAVNG